MICNLPTELLNAIFKLLANPARDPNAPTPVSQVCRRFRDVAVSLPAFWTSVSNAQAPDMYNAYLRRSKQADLTVSVHLPVAKKGGIMESNLPSGIKQHESASAEGLRHMEEFFLAVVPCSTRWAEFSIELLYGAPGVMRLDDVIRNRCLGLQLPRLTSFATVTKRLITDEVAHPRLAAEFLTAEFRFMETWVMPNLTDMSTSFAMRNVAKPIQGGNTRTSLTACDITLGLTEVQFANEITRAVIGLIASSPLLESLHLQFARWQSSDGLEAALTEIDLQKLKVLSLTAINCEQSTIIPILLRSLNVPLVSQLDICIVLVGRDVLGFGELQIGPWLQDVLPDDRKYNEVVSFFLTIDVVQAPQHVSWNRVFNSFPALRHLVLHTPNVYPPDTLPEPLDFPKLLQVQLIRCTEFDLDFIKLLHSRLHVQDLWKLAGRLSIESCRKLHRDEVIEIFSEKWVRWCSDEEDKES